MELSPGYKLTEVGVIPEDWDVLRLGELGEALIGLTYRPEDVRKHGTLVLRSSNIQNDTLVFDDNVFVNARIPGHIRLRPEDVLVCVRNGSRNLIGKSVLLDERVEGMTFGAFMAIYRSSIGKLASYYFQSEILKRQISDNLGATINQITNRSLTEFVVPLAPSHAEREAIAAALGEADALIRGLTRVIAKKRDLKQAAMQQLLTGCSRLPGFRGQWESRPLSHDVNLLSGHHILARHCNTQGEGCAYLTGPADFPDGRIQHTKYTTRPSTICAPHDILITVKGSGTGTMAIANATYCISRQLMALRARTWHQQFLYFSLLQNADSFRSAATGLIPGLSRADILDQRLPIPSTFAEQTAIATVLSDMDAELTALEARLAKTKALKQAMMQELLTGRTRLVAPELAHA